VPELWDSARELGGPGHQSASLSLEPGAGETLDSICGGQVQIIQRARGYRFNLDPVLLAHHAASEPVRGPIVDLGTGSGIIALILARKFGRRPVTGLELQPSLYALAQRNVQLNRCERSVSLVLGDLRGAASLFPAGSFAQVVCNPPYGARAQGRVNPEEEKAIARHELACSLGEVVGAAEWLLKARGSLELIYPAARLVELLALLRERRLEPRRLRLVHPRGGRPAKLALVSAIKGAGVGLCVAPPLVVHPEGEAAGFTEEVQRMLG
jgi:tRNA1Val (adenine37-N6)-methyltransferase